MDVEGIRSHPALVRLAAWAGPTAILLVGSVMLAWSWGHWPDVLIDFGRELYVPWRISEGAVLYRDISYFNGPLSPHLNALWFSLFGVGLRTLALCNIALVTGLTALLYLNLKRISGAFPATVAGLVFVTLFAFALLDSVGNYNYVSPYSHEVTHGLLFAFLALTAFSFQPQHGDKALGGAGLALGCVFLTKAEIFLACGSAIGVGLILTFWALASPWRTALRSTATLAAATLVAPLAALAALSLAMPFETAWRGLVDPLTSSFNPEVTSLRFYQWGMGTLDPAESLKEIRVWTLRFATLFVPTAVLALLLRRRGALAWGVSAVALTAMFFYISQDSLPWMHAVRPLPVLLLVIGLGSLVEFLRTLRAGEDISASLFRVVLIVFALVLLAKIVLNVRLMHYGFALAMPGTMILVVALTGWLPRLIDRQRGFGPLFVAVALATLLAAEYSMLRVMNALLKRHEHVVASGSDAFHAGARGPYVTLALADIASRIGPEETLAVLPEGIMINYLSRRVNPTPYTNYMPPELRLYGEQQILDAFRTAPPDWLLIVHKFTGEYGYSFFGQDYGKSLYYWLTHHNEPVKLYGQPPLRRRGSFGIRILRRIDAERRTGAPPGTRSS